MLRKHQQINLLKTPYITFIPLFDVVALSNDVNDLRGGIDDEISKGLLELSSDDMTVVVNVSSVTADVEFISGDRTAVVKITPVLLLFVTITEIIFLISHVLNITQI